MLLAPAFLDELRARTLLSALVGRSIKLQRAGREFKACCPFHDEKTPSFYVNDEKGFYHCFGCGAHGDAIRFLTESRGLNFVDAVKELADAAGMSLPAPDRIARERTEKTPALYEIMERASNWFARQLQEHSGLATRTYLERRGISKETQVTFQLGFAPQSRSALKAALAESGLGKLIEAGLLIQPDEESREPYDRFRGRLMIPIRDPRGRPIAFGGRLLGDGEPKYLNSPETPLFDKGSTLFNLDLAAPAARQAQRILIVEGYLDVLALHQAGIKEVVAPLGTALTEGQMGRLWKISDVPILCFDGDTAGRRAAFRAAIRALAAIEPGRTLRFAILPEGQDPDDVIRRDGAGGFEAYVKGAVSLDELIWQNELAASGVFRTPEDRAALGKRLRDHTKHIRDDFLRKQYLAEFNRRVFEHFRDKDRARFGKGSGAETRHVPPEMRRIAELGIDRATIVPAVIRGLVRYPSIIAEHAEIIARLIVHDRELKLVQRVLLEAALAIPSLDALRLEAVLREEGLGGFIDEMRRSGLIAFSFLRSDAVSDAAQRDLVAVLAHLVSVFQIRREEARLTRELASGAPQDTFDELVSLKEAEVKVMREFADLVLMGEEVTI